MHEIKIYKTPTMLSIDFNLLLLILHVTLNIGLYRYICYENHVITSHFPENLKMASSITIPRRLPLLLVKDSVLLPGSSMRIPVKSMKK